MNQAAELRPSLRYLHQQMLVRWLLDMPSGAGLALARSLQEQMEAEFIRAWGLLADEHEHALDMQRLAAWSCDGFDHCTYYLDPDTQARVVVTQPYLDASEVVETLTEGLVLPNRKGPQILAAPEWAFYYPGWATLVMIKFPRGYERVLKALNRLRPHGSVGSMDPKDN